jgi:hypothetical protein
MGMLYVMIAVPEFRKTREHYQSIALPQDFSGEKIARDWTLSESDKKEVNRYRTNSHLFIAIQLCAVRLYGPFLVEVNFSAAFKSPTLLTSSSIRLITCIGNNTLAYNCLLLLTYTE